jgi:hypothetical protein
MTQIVWHQTIHVIQRRMMWKEIWEKHCEVTGKCSSSCMCVNKTGFNNTNGLNGHLCKGKQKTIKR